MQSVPPISWLVLAIIWFGLEGKASIFIVVISTLPMMIINLIEGINNVDCKLIEMGKVFKFSKQKMIINIMIPSIIPYFQSALQIVIGLGWKIVIMGEVLSSSNGIGGEITNARLNIETNYIFAWTIIIVLLFYGTDKLILYIFNKKLKGDRYDFKNTRFE
ncbi:ABC transporter permease [Clostridium sp. L74]|nr:ABC transporter permease [Clostridium sp. L74]